MVYEALTLLILTACLMRVTHMITLCDFQIIMCHQSVYVNVSVDPSHFHLQNLVPSSSLASSYTACIMCHDLGFFHL